MKSSGKSEYPQTNLHIFSFINNRTMLHCDVSRVNIAPNIDLVIFI